MARAGVFDDLDAALNYHPDRVNMPGKGSQVGVYDLVFRFHGRTAHAGGAPHQGRSALDAVELMNVGVNYMREHITEKTRIHYVITNGGKLPNVVPDEAEVWYFVRAHQRKELDEVASRVRRIAEGAALMTETRLEVQFRGACSNVLNNHVLADLHYEAMKVVGPIQFTAEEKAFAQKINDAFAAENARSVFDRMQVPPESKEKVAALAGQPLLGENFPGWDASHVATGSTDVGDVSWITPLSMLRTACTATGAPGHSWAFAATGATSIGHKGMMHAAKVMALVAVDLVERPETLAAARREFEERTRGEPYRCPIPPEVEPPRALEGAERGR
jgi:aminobenzoyl-glutamate utilization protein B